jgi:hypothetical protein
MVLDAKEGLKRQHEAWLGMVQPVGLVATAMALAEAQLSARPDALAEGSHWLRDRLGDEGEGGVALAEALEALVGWDANDWVQDPAQLAPLALHLGGAGLQEGEAIQPDAAVPGESGGWRVLVQEWPLGQPSMRRWANWSR